jgi:aspartate/methionine/tyrosine aminotransferase
MVAERTVDFKSLSLLGISKLAEGLEDVIYLNVGEPDFDTPRHIVMAAERALKEGHTHYTEEKGIPALRRAIAEKENMKAKADICEEQVLVTPGATGALFAACMSLIDCGDEIIIQAPSYPGHIRAVTVAGGKPVPVSLEEDYDFVMNIDELNEKVTSKTKAIIVSSPTNPTGTVFERDVLKAIVEIAVDNELFIVSDEVYENFVYDDAEFVSLGEFPEMEHRNVRVNSFSKTYAMTGWRIGYAIAPKEITSRMAKFSCASSVCVNSIAQYGALAALEGPQKCVEAMLSEYDERRRFVVKELSKIPGVRFVDPKGAFYVFPNVEEFEMNSLELVKYLVREARVLLSPGYPFFGSKGRFHVRLSYTASLDALRIAMERINSALRELEGT